MKIDTAVTAARRLVPISKTLPGVLPPGPRLPRPVQAALMLRYGVRYVAACRRRYGRVFTLRLPSLGTLVYLADPADIKTVFAGDPRVFHAGEANSMLSGLLGDSSVLVIDEDVHRDRRSLGHRVLGGLVCMGSAQSTASSAKSKPSVVGTSYVATTISSAAVACA